MNKTAITAIADYAAQGFAVALGLDNDFRTNNNCGYLEIAFTKRCSQTEKAILLDFIKATCEILGIKYYEAPIETVTRDSELWEA